MMNLEVRPFSSWEKLGYDKALILTRDGNECTLTEHTRDSSGINPPSQKHKLYKYHGVKGCNEGVIIRKNLETGADTRIEPYKVDLDYDKAKKYGFDVFHPSKITAKRIIINDCGTKLDLIAHNGEVREVCTGGSKIGEDISKMTPFTKRWIKKYIDFLSKIR